MDLAGKMLALASALFWAGAVILFKRAGDTIQPLALSWFKAALGSLVLLPLLLLDGLGGLSGRPLLMALASGVLGMAVSDTLFFMAMERLGASLTAIVSCLYAPFVLLTAWAMLGDVPRAAQVAGVFCVAAAVLVVSFDRGHPRARPGRRRLAAGFLAGTASMAAMAVAISLMKPVLAHHSLWAVAELRVLAALGTLTVMMFLRRDRRELFASLTGHGAWRLALPGAFLGNVLSMVTWVAGFKFTSVNSAAILVQTHTVFIVIMATLILKEPFGRHRLLGTTLAFAGAVMVLVR